MSIPLSAPKSAAVHAQGAGVAKGQGVVGSPAWLDSQYNNRALVPAFAQHLQRWATDSLAARQQLPQARLDVPYFDTPQARPSWVRQGQPPRWTFFPPPTRLVAQGGAGVRRYCCSSTAAIGEHLTRPITASSRRPFVAQGACVVVPNYTLCPAVRVSDITRQMVAAVAWVWQHIAEHGGDPDRITVVGHSAGGQLVGMLLSTDWLAVGRQLGVALPAQPLQHGVSISGLFDMEPIRQTPFLADLGLSPEEAANQSPALLPVPSTSVPRGRLTTVVGGDESDEFKRQNRLIRQAWGPDAVPVCEELPGLNHFSVVEELVKSGSRLHRLVSDALFATGI
jgi:arylformamidase